MREQFAKFVEEKMAIEPRVRLVLADVGYGMWDSVKGRYPDRVHDVGSAEQLAMGVSVGLALSNLIPIFYTISPFLIYRPWEWIELYLCREYIPVKLAASGEHYVKDGPTHSMVKAFPEELKIFNTFDAWFNCHDPCLIIL